jgi:hypothetical protein
MVPLRRSRDDLPGPVPSIIDSSGGWLVLAALPDIPMEDASWAERPEPAIAIVVNVLQVLSAADGHVR